METYIRASSNVLDKVKNLMIGQSAAKTLKVYKSMGKVQRLGVEIIQSIHTHERKGIIPVVGNRRKSMEEIWRTIKEFDRYEVSNKGRVRNKETKRVLKPWIINSGYQTVTLSKEGKGYKKTIHRIVASTFIDNKYNKEIVNHIDHNKLNNKVDNLEWVTQKENCKHSIDAGRSDTNTARKQLSKVSNKAIYQKDMNGNIIKLWDSPTQVEKESNGYFSSSKLSLVANGHRKSHKGFIWEYENKNSQRSKTRYLSILDKNGNVLHEKVTMNKTGKIVGKSSYKAIKRIISKLEIENKPIEYSGYFITLYEGK